jgi:hypothetical protein
MRIQRPKQKPLLVILVKRVVFFFLCLCALAMLLYVLGNFQGFMDSTQTILLRISIATGILLGLGCIYGILLSAWMLFHKELSYAGSILLYLALGVFGAAMAVAAQFILVIGNR